MEKIKTIGETYMAASGIKPESRVSFHSAHALAVLTHLLTYLLTHLLTYLLTYLLTFLLTCLLTFLLTYLLTYLLACLLAYLLTCLVWSSIFLKHSTIGSKTQHYRL